MTTSYENLNIRRQYFKFSLVLLGLSLYCIGFDVVEERSGRRQPGAGAKVWRKWLHQSPVTCADNVTALIRASPNRICVAPLIAAPGELLLAVHRSYRNACGKRECYNSVMNFVYI